MKENLQFKIDHVDLICELADKSLCSGCSACFASCSNNAISMKEDDDGFLVPVIDRLNCKNCGRCTEVCPVLQKKNFSTDYIRCFAAFSRDSKIVLSSSSGGVFQELALYFLQNGGVVWGCVFCAPDYVVHARIDSINDLHKLCGSKYFQSDLGNSFQMVRADLRKGIPVMFSGTPCQIAGLKSFLNHQYDKLITVELICHGVPSSKVWKTYLNEIIDQENFSVVRNVNFRDKRFHSDGQHCYRVSITGEKDGKIQNFNERAVENLFVNATLKGLCLRSSCYNCQAKNGKAGADITLGDFWGIEKVYPDFVNQQGISAVIVHSINGIDLWRKIEKRCNVISVDLNAITVFNPRYQSSVIKPLGRTYFMQYLGKKDFHKNLNYALHGPEWLFFAKRVYRKLRSFF